ALAAAAVSFVARTNHFADLAIVAHAPPYQGMAVRGPSSPGAASFEAGMRAYMAGDYTAARDSLARALDAGADVEPTAFFLGASDLMTRQVRDARARFAQVIARGDNPYRRESRYYRAIAALRE